MEKSNYNRGGGGAGRGRGGGSGCGRGVSGGGRGSSGGGRGGNNYQKYHQAQYQTGGGAGNSGGGGGNNCQQHNQGQYQSGGYGRRGGRGGDRSGTQVGSKPPLAQPWGDRPVQGGQGGTQWPESATGQGAGATGGRGAWSGGPPHVAGRGSWASAVGGGAGAGQAQRRIMFLFLFMFMFLFLFIVFVAENGHHTRLFLENQGGDVRRNISPGQFWTQKLFNHCMISAIMKILEQASGHTTMFSMMSIISHLICCRSSYTSYASLLLDALSLSPLSHQFAMLPLLPIGDKRRYSLLLQLRHQLLSHHHRLNLRLHLTISSDFPCSMQ